MSTILATYSAEPNFPATAQHPDAQRYKVGNVWVDTRNGEPPAEDVEAFLNPPTPVSTSITRRQLLIGLKNAELISAQEAIAAATAGAVPKAIQAIFDALPTQAARDDATITWASMSVVERAHPLVAMVGQANDMSEWEIDEFFIACVLI